MYWLAVQGLKGGVGTTTVAAHLAVACHRQGRPVLLVDLSPGNLLRVYLGMPWEVRRGLLTTLASGSPWYQAAYRSAAGIPFIPYGQDAACHEKQASRTALRRLFQQMRKDSTQLQLPQDTLVIMDCPALNPAENLLLDGLVELNLLVVNPEPACYASLRQHEPFAGVHLLVNGLHPESTLECDIQDLLMADTRMRTLPVTIQHDAFIPESLAWKQTVFQSAPQSQAAQDFALLATWVTSQLREVRHAG